VVNAATRLNKLEFITESLLGCEPFNFATTGVDRWVKILVACLVILLKTETVRYRLDVQWL
jgi:hypothetical protein